MQWEQLTAPDFAKAVQETGVCILPIGVLEKHSEHLPLGTDYLIAQKVAALAAEKEPAVVFPPYYFGQIYEARSFPGTISLKPTLLLEVLQSVLDEIGRNGFKKIIIFNWHGGNTSLIQFMAQCSLWEEKPYMLYVHRKELSKERKKEWDMILDTSHHGHACECETSISLAVHEELVKMGQVPAAPGSPLNRLQGIPYTGIWWYGDYPTHYCGDARTASIEKGRKLLALQVDSLADTIKAVKEDKAAPALQREFFERAKSPSESNID